MTYYMLRKLQYFPICFSIEPHLNLFLQKKSINGKGMSIKAPLYVDSPFDLNEEDLPMLEAGQQLSPEELQQEARALLAERGKRAEAARRLDVTRGTITNALTTETPTRYLKTLQAIVEAMSDYRIETETVTVCRVVKKAS